MTTTRRRKNDTSTGADKDELAPLAARVRTDPGDDEAWDALEEIASATNRPDETGELYRELLGRPGLDRTVALALGQRAFQFHEEWFGDDPAPLLEVLSRMFDVDPSPGGWAFQHLTMVYTNRERWDDLLTLYDRVIESASDPIPLLEEAAGLAKDVAGKPDRAIDYLERLLPLKGGDAKVAASLERLLERQERYQDLIRFWEARMDDLSPDDAHAMRVRIAELWLDRLGRAAEALEGARAVMVEGGDRATACGLLERIVAHKSATEQVRRQALDLLRDQYVTEDRTTDLVHALDVALEYAKPDDRVDLHREAGDRLAVRGRDEEALEHYASVLELDPTAHDVLERLRRVAEKTGRDQQLLNILSSAAGACGEPAPRIALRMEAADVARRRLKDTETARGLYAQVLAEPEVDRAVALEVASRLADLHEEAGRSTERLQMLERVAELEEGAGRRPALGMAALLAEELGELDRALAAWAARLDLEPADLEALEATIRILEVSERFDDLVAALRRRAQTAGVPPVQRRADLVRIARIQAERLGAVADSITTWQAVSAEFGEDAETADALAGLYGSAGGAGELTALLERATARDSARLADLACRLGDARWEQGDITGAVAAYVRALRVDPAHAAARAGLGRVKSGAERVHAVAALDDAYGATEDWQGRLTLLPGRIQAAADPREQVRLLREVAEIQERRAADAGAALDALGRAFALAPGDAGLEAELLRVAEAAGALDRGAAAFAYAAAASGDALRTAHLRVEEARLHERLGASDAALDAYAAALLADPTRADAAEALVEAAGAGGRYREAEHALAAALERRPGDRGLLGLLAQVQRHVPGPALHDTLVRLADTDRDDLDPEHEAAELALDVLGDRELSRASLERLYREASRLWRRGQTARGSRDAATSAAWAADRLLEILETAGDTEAAIELMLDAARPPCDRERARAFQKRAARTATAVGNVPRAIALHRDVLVDSPEDIETMAALAELYEKEARLGELYALRQRELAVARNRDQRLALRLEVVRVVSALEARGGRVQMLLANLEEEPGHGASLEGLVSLFTSQKRHEELAALLSDQANRLAERDPSGAAALWSRVAAIAEGPLGDVEQALEAYRHVVELTPTTESLDALSRIHTDRGEHAAAARWLKRRLEMAGEGVHTELALRLARAHVGAGRPERAVPVLQEAFAADPTNDEIRELLAAQYEATKTKEPLAALLVSACEHVRDESKLLAMMRRAAEIYRELGTPEKSIGVLERGAELAPDDRGLHHMRAEALQAAGRLDESRAVLEKLVESFGRRRGPERAQVHGELARIAHAMGDTAGALEQLDLATKMDMDNAPMLLMLGDLAREGGELDRAERAYRTLLLVVRRKGSEVEVGAGQVLYELHALASKRGDETQAKELIESALEAALQSDTEARALGRAALARGDAALARTILEKRLPTATGEARAELLAELAAILEGPLRAPAEALERRIEALRLAPHSAALHDATLKLARDQGQVARYATALEEISGALRREVDAPLAADLLFRLGAIVEADLSDLDRAAELYRRAEESGRRFEAWQALVRVARARRDVAEERRVLAKLVREEALDAEARAEGLYRLAELSFAESETDAGLEALREAYVLDPRFDAAGALLRPAIAAAPESDALLGFYEKVARESGDADMLLDFLERRAARPDATLIQVREAFDRAAVHGGETRAEALLQRAVELGREQPEGVGSARWALLALAERAQERADTARALGWLREAVESAEEHERRELELRLAHAAMGPGGDLRVAADTYERLLEGDLTDAAIFKPLLSIYRTLRDEDRLNDLASRLLDALLDPAARNVVRMERARFLLGMEERQYDAVDLLKQVLEEDPDDTEAPKLLAELYEKSGYDEDLVHLLERQFDVARDNQDLAAIADTALRLGSVLSKVRREDAVDLYRQALEWLPEDRRVIESLLALLGDDGDARERAEVRERLLATESGDAATRLALELYRDWEVLEDEEGMQRALELGYRGAPDDPGVRDLLEHWYRDRERFDGLASFLVKEAERREGAASVALRREAAVIYRERLGEAAAAVEVLRGARAAAPEDLDLLNELVDSLLQNGETSIAIAEVGASLAEHVRGPKRVKLLRTRARLALAVDDTRAAIADLDEAYAASQDGAVAQDLLHALGEERNAASATGDRDRERAVVLRLVDVHSALGDTPAVRSILSEWTATDPSDRDALLRLRDMDLAAEDWDAVAATCARLIGVETGEAQVDAAMLLADACETAGRPEAARDGLEAVRAAQPAHPRIAERVRSLYEAVGAHRELAQLLCEDAAASDGEQRFELLRRAGRLLIDSVGDSDAAIPPLEMAFEMRNDDHRTAVLLSDAYIGAGRYADAGQLLERAIAAHTRRRSPELAQLQHRMARLARAAGDPQLEMQWLNAALDSDKNNGHVAAELAQLAMELGDHEVALNALRAVTLMKAEGPMTRAEAFLHQARIAHQRGEERRAVLWARKAKSEDPNLQEADDFLRQIEG